MQRCHRIGASIVTHGVEDAKRIVCAEVHVIAGHPEASVAQNVDKLLFYWKKCFNYQKIGMERNFTQKFEIIRIETGKMVTLYPALG